MGKENKKQEGISAEIETMRKRQKSHSIFILMFIFFPSSLHIFICFVSLNVLTVWPICQHLSPFVGFHRTEAERWNKVYPLFRDQNPSPMPQLWSLSSEKSGFSENIKKSTQSLNGGPIWFYEKCSFFLLFQWNILFSNKATTRNIVHLVYYY